MAATEVTVMLAQPYRLRPAEEKIVLAAEDMTYAKWQRNLSEQFILRAAQQRWGETMPRKDSKVFRGIKRALDEETEAITLDGTQAAFLFDLFLSATSEEKVTFPPVWAEWVGQWLDYLEDLRVKGQAG